MNNGEYLKAIGRKIKSRREAKGLRAICKIEKGKIDNIYLL
jgi:hypothetical protein